MPSASSIRHKPSSWDCASIGNVKQRHRKDTAVRRPCHNWIGIASDLNTNLTEEDIAEARREMWGNFPERTFDAVGRCRHSRNTWEDQSLRNYSHLVTLLVSLLPSHRPHQSLTRITTSRTVKW